MAHYRVRYVMEGAQPSTNQKRLKKGDQVSFITRLGKEKKVSILDAFSYDGRIVYLTDHLGVIFSEELLFLSAPVQRPLWNSRQQAVS